MGCHTPASPAGGGGRVAFHGQIATMGCHTPASAAGRGGRVAFHGPIAIIGCHAPGGPLGEGRSTGAARPSLVAAVRAYHERPRPPVAGVGTSWSDSDHWLPHAGVGPGPRWACGIPWSESDHRLPHAPAARSARGGRPALGGRPSSPLFAPTTTADGR